MNLTLDNIHKSYGDNAILKGGVLQVQKGAVTALIGKNGVGKTTTFKVICGLTSIDQGSLTWNSEVINSKNLKWKGKIGYLAEHNPLYTQMFVREFLTLACRIHKVEDIKSRIDSVIQATGLNEYENYRIHQLSKGYKQRVGIAQALINDPELLILDEPTSGLDPSQLIEIRALIKELSKDKAVILSSHILSEVESICDKVFLIEDGKIKSIDSFESESLWQVHFDQKVNAEWFEEIGLVSRFDDHSIEMKLADVKSRYRVFDIAVDHKVRIIEMSPISRNLESNFLDKTAI